MSASVRKASAGVRECRAYLAVAKLGSWSRSAEPSSLFDLLQKCQQSQAGIRGVLVAKRRTVATFGLVPGPRVPKVSTVTDRDGGCWSQNAELFSLFEQRRGDEWRGERGERMEGRGERREERGERGEGEKGEGREERARRGDRRQERAERRKQRGDRGEEREAGGWRGEGSEERGERREGEKGERGEGRGERREERMDEWMENGMEERVEAGIG